MKSELTGIEKLYILLNKDRVIKFCLNNSLCSNLKEICPFKLKTQYLCNKIHLVRINGKEEWAKILREWQP